MKRYIILSIVFLTASLICHAQELPNNSTPPIPAEKPVENEDKKPQQPVAETIEIDSDTLQLNKPKDSTKRKPILEHKLISSATDYKEIDRINNTITLYNEAKIIYGDITLEAGKIIMNMNTGDIFATVSLTQQVFMFKNRYLLKDKMSLNQTQLSLIKTHARLLLITLLRHKASLMLKPK